jgi:hypothetical protein
MVYCVRRHYMRFKSITLSRARYKITLNASISISQSTLRVEVVMLQCRMQRKQSVLNWIVLCSAACADLSEGQQQGLFT